MLVNRQLVHINEQKMAMEQAASATKAELRNTIKTCRGAVHHLVAVIRSVPVEETTTCRGLSLRTVHTQRMLCRIAVTALRLQHQGVANAA